MAKNSFTEELRRQASEKLASNIRKLERRLSEVEALDGTAGVAELEGLEVAIRQALGDTFGMGSFEYNLYRAAADLQAGFAASRTSLDLLPSVKASSIALLKRAIQSQQERFEDEYPDAPAPAAVRHPSIAGRAMAGATRVGSGASGTGVAGIIGTTSIGEIELEASAEVRDQPQQAYELLMARVAVLEAALAAPKPRPDLPIGPGHNSPPEFETPFEEEEIRQFIDLLRAQKATAPTDLPKLIEASDSAEAKVSKLKTHIDDFVVAACKGAGAEAGKRLIQVPFWLAVGASLQAVMHALEIWISAVVR